jgi:hypothetical protein
LDGLAGNRYEGVDVEYGMCGNQVLRHISCQHWQYRVIIMVGQGGMVGGGEGKRDGNICESTNND